MEPYPEAAGDAVPLRHDATIAPCFNSARLAQPRQHLLNQHGDAPTLGLLAIQMLASFVVGQIITPCPSEKTDSPIRIHARFLSPPELRHARFHHRFPRSVKSERLPQPAPQLTQRHRRVAWTKRTSACRWS